jgi:PAS domain S-box-containing protein
VRAGVTAVQSDLLRADLVRVSLSSSREEVDLHRAVAALQLVGAPREERFDRITRTAQRVLGTPLSFLNLVDGDDLWVTSCVGFDGRRVRREAALCRHTLATGAPLFVDDARLDPRFRDDPLVTGAPHVRAYAGQPLRGPSGHVVGTLCAVDLAPRAWTAEQAQALADLVTWAEAELAHGDVARQLAEGEAVRQQHAQVLRSAGQGILGVGPDGVVVVANPAAERLTGWAADGLAGRHLHATLHPRTEVGAPCLDPLCALRISTDATPTDGAALRLREALWHRDGWAFPAQVTVAPLVGTTLAGGGGRGLRRHQRPAGRRPDEERVRRRRQPRAAHPAHLAARLPRPAGGRHRR